MSTEFESAIIIGVLNNEASSNTLQAVDAGLLDSYMTDRGLILGFKYESTEDYLYLDMDIFKNMTGMLKDEFFSITDQDAKVYLILHSY